MAATSSISHAVVPMDVDGTSVVLVDEPPEDASVDALVTYMAQQLSNDAAFAYAAVQHWSTQAFKGKINRYDAMRAIYEAIFNSPIHLVVRNNTARIFKEQQLELPLAMLDKRIIACIEMLVQASYDATGVPPFTVPKRRTRDGKIRTSAFAHNDMLELHGLNAMWRMRLAAFYAAADIRPELNGYRAGFVARERSIHANYLRLTTHGLDWRDADADALRKRVQHILDDDERIAPCSVHENLKALLFD